MMESQTPVELKIEQGDPTQQQAHAWARLWRLLFKAQAEEEVEVSKQ